jgi:hypothetical protein
MAAKRNRRPGSCPEQAAKSWTKPSARKTRRSSRLNQPDFRLSHLALAVQAPLDVMPALRRVTRDRLAAAIAAGDDEAIERLPARLDALLNDGRAGR